MAQHMVNFTVVGQEDARKSTAWVSTERVEPRAPFMNRRDRRIAAAKARRA